MNTETQLKILVSQINIIKDAKFKQAVLYCVLSEHSDEKSSKIESLYNEYICEPFYDIVVDQNTNSDLYEIWDHGLRYFYDLKECPTEMQAVRKIQKIHSDDLFGTTITWAFKYMDEEL